MTVDTIDEVIGRLDAIVGWARRTGSRSGYFAALYRRVTLEVWDGIREGRFDDGPRTERLDVIFAERYLEAFARWRRGEPTTRSWAVAFEAADDWWPIVLQHLLLGINAHINLDLGIATARTAPGDALADLRGDFREINRILAALVDDVQRRLGEVWPLLHVLDWVGGRTDEEIIHFQIEVAREHAWTFARRLNDRPESEWRDEIRRVDESIEGLGRLVRHPGPLLGTVTKVVRLGELRSVPRVIDLLS